VSFGVVNRELPDWTPAYLCIGCTFNICWGEVAARARRCRILRERPDVNGWTCSQDHATSPLAVFGSALHNFWFFRSSSTCEIRKQGTISVRENVYPVEQWLRCVSTVNHSRDPHVRAVLTFLGWNWWSTVCWTVVILTLIQMRQERV
jgi:hypothetical protein